MQPNPTVLIVDDIEIFRDLASQFLGSTCRVLTAADAEAGIAMAMREQPDVALVDQYLPGTDGEAVCRAIKADPDLRHTSVVMLLASGDADARADAIRAGADDVLVKPLTRVDLIDAVRRFSGARVRRGQPRIGLEIPVELRLGKRRVAATGRNLSRGGIFVETDRSLAPGTEVSLSFTLPETRYAVAPTAQVRWRRPGEPDAPRPCYGLGLRFLAIDAATSRQLDDYIFIRTPARETSRPRT